MWDDFSMLKYDPATCPRKDCTQVLDVYVGSFFNVEIRPINLSKKGIAHKMLNVYLGSFFNVEIRPPPSS
jgi:hypothetical protein